MESINTYKLYEQSLTHHYTMIKATASWCGPCKKIHPQIVELAENEKYKDIHFYEYDIDEIDDCPLQEYIRVVPTFLFFEESKLVNTIKGSDVKAVEAYLNETVNQINSPKNSNLEELQEIIKTNSEEEVSEEDSETEQDK
jgi:thiol-disulfide isomerase/thioredoxin